MSDEEPQDAKRFCERRGYLAGESTGLSSGLGS